MDRETLDNLASFRAANDQLKGAMEEIAALLGVFFRALRKNGFSRKESMELCVLKLQILLFNNTNNDDN